MLRPFEANSRLGFDRLQLLSTHGRPRHAGGHAGEVSHEIRCPEGLGKFHWRDQGIGWRYADLFGLKRYWSRGWQPSYSSLVCLAVARRARPQSLAASTLWQDPARLHLLASLLLPLPPSLRILGEQYFQQAGHTRQLSLRRTCSTFAHIAAEGSGLKGLALFGVVLDPALRTQRRCAWAADLGGLTMSMVLPLQSLSQPNQAHCTSYHMSVLQLIRVLACLFLSLASVRSVQASNYPAAAQAQHGPLATLSVPTTAMAKRGLGSSGGAAVLERKKLDLTQKTPTTTAPKLDNSGGSGGIGKILHNGGGGDDDGGDDDDYFSPGDEGGDDGDGFFKGTVRELYDQESIKAILQEWGRTFTDIPLMIRQSAEMGLFSSAQLVRFMSMDVRPSMTRSATRALSPQVCCVPLLFCQETTAFILVGTTLIPRASARMNSFVVLEAPPFSCSLRHMYQCTSHSATGQAQSGLFPLNYWIISGFAPRPELRRKM